jgi:hypothetical protein
MSLFSIILAELEINDDSEMVARRIWLHLRGQIVAPILFVIMLLVVIYLGTIVGCYFGVEERAWVEGRPGGFSCDRLLSSDALHYLFPWWPVQIP